MLKLERIPMAEIKAAYQPGPGRHWFDKDAMSFFKTKLPGHGYHTPRGSMFVTSETRTAGVVSYSVRLLTGPGCIRTLHSYPSAADALTAIHTFAGETA